MMLKASLHYPRFFIIILAGLICLNVGVALAQDAPASTFAWQDPAKIVTAEPCGECHASEYRVWQKTPHATGFKTLHRKESAEQIARKMGFRLLKRQSLCLQCHYTTIEKNGQQRAVSGVSCESCHGAARDWINVHNDYGGKQFNFQTETPEHKTQRIGQSKNAGMLRPSELYGVAANCFQCHTVPNEKLVNVGGHSTGSEFELVKRVDTIRHNFLQSFLTGDGTQNAERSPEQRRVMYVTGRALALEYSLRSVAKATEAGLYEKAAIRHTRRAVSELRAISERVDLSEVNTMLEISGQIKIQINNEPALLAAADDIREQTKQFIKNRDGSQLDKLDNLILGIEEPDLAEAPAEKESGVAPLPATIEKAATEEPLASTTQKELQPEPVGEFKRFIRPRSSHRTIGASCSCHEHDGQNKWWVNDRHYNSAEPFF